MSLLLRGPRLARTSGAGDAAPQDYHGHMRAQPDAQNRGALFEYTDLKGFPEGSENHNVS